MFRPGRSVLAMLCFGALMIGPDISALAFTSGSTGALGAFAPVSNTTVILPPDGILNYTTITIPSGVTVTFQPNSANTPVILLAQGNITIGGQLYVNGVSGLVATPAGSTVQLGGLGGPGGYRGGQGGQKGLANNSGAPGQGPNAGTSGRFDAVVTANGNYGADSSFVSLIPLFGGSGGGGGTGDATLWGTSGGGGGGALVLASSTQITVQTTGTVAANGGNGPIYTTVCSTYSGGPGSGGAVRLVAPAVTVQGGVAATGGGGGCVAGVGGPGRIRIECTTCSLVTTNPVASISNVLGPVASASTPPLINIPTLTISTIGGLSVPVNPSGIYTAADVTMPTGTVNPVPVTLIANNLPVGTVLSLRIIPASGADQFFVSSPTTGTFGSSTATAAAQFPYSQISLIQAYANVPLSASLAPKLDGELAERVVVVAVAGEPSRSMFVTPSGRLFSVDPQSGNTTALN
ncbi:MAG: hypothetical protein H8K05_02570 [Nitrospira sp.]|nr:hypothetical protein [Nitrospira sp.]